MATGTGVTYYVAKTGSDSNDGRSLGEPFLTIGKAARTVSAGDVIEVRAGAYAESVMIERSGAPHAWILMRGYNGERPVIRGTGSGPSVWFYHDDCDQDVIGAGSGNSDCHAFYWILRGLDIQGSASGGADGNAVKLDVPKVKLIDNRLCCAVADIVKVVRTANDAEILSNEIWQDPSITAPSGNAQGVDIVGADRVHVASNDVHDIADIGIYAKGNAREPVFENNRLVNVGTQSATAQGGNAMMLGQSTDAERLVDGPYETYDGIMRNNVVIGCDWACLATSSSQNVHLINNSCYDTGRRTHGSILLSNESEVSQAGTTIEIKNNIIFGSSSHPVVRITSDALTSLTTLIVDKNVFWVPGGAPTFTPNDDETGLSFTAWKTRYTSLSGHADGSLVADPLYATTSGPTPLTLGPASPAIDHGSDSQFVTSDFLGVSRPRGASTDIGAYEY